MPTIEERVAALATADRVEALKTIGLFLAELEHGTIRAAMRDADGIWQVQPWIKLGILAAELIRGKQGLYRFDELWMQG